MAENVLRTIMPVLTVLSLPILFWPTIILVIALVRQARAQMILKGRHIAIFIAVQVIWLALLFGLSSALILRPLGLRF